MRLIKKYLGIIIAIVFCGICFKIVYEKFLAKNNFHSSTLSMPSSCWRRENVLETQFLIDDLEASYDISLKVNYTNDYSYANIYVGYNIFVDTLEIEKGEKVYSLFSKEWGKPIGKKSFISKNIILTVPLSTNCKFSHLGLYKLRIQQHMRNHSLFGIKEVEVVINKSSINQIDKKLLDNE